MMYKVGGFYIVTCTCMCTASFLLVWLHLYDNYVSVIWLHVRFFKMLTIDTYWLSPWCATV